MVQHIEAMIFAAEKPVAMEEIIETLEKSSEQTIDPSSVEECLEKIRAKFEHEDFSFGLVEIAGGYQFLTKSDYNKTLSIHLNLKAKTRLSTAAMETLAIIAYRQPITRTAIEQIRGVNCDYSIQKLLEKELIEITGRSEGPGNPLLYKTSDLFMEHFGIKSPKDLPQLKEVSPTLNINEIGMIAEETTDNTSEAEIAQTYQVEEVNETIVVDQESAEEEIEPAGDQKNENTDL